MVWAILLGTASIAAPDLFETLFERSRAKEKDLQTIQASFVETTVSSLLIEPMVARGHLVAAARPLKVRLDYTAPEKKVVLLDENRLIVIWPGRNEREELAITDLRERVDQYFTRASLAELRGHFAIRATAAAGIRGMYHIDMVPKRKQIKRGLDRLELWLDEKSLVVVQMRMWFPGGDAKTFKLDAVQVNAPAPDSLFEAR